MICLCPWHIIFLTQKEEKKVEPNLNGPTDNARLQFAIVANIQQKLQLEHFTFEQYSKGKSIECVFFNKTICELNNL